MSGSRSKAFVVGGLLLVGASVLSWSKSGSLDNGPLAEDHSMVEQAEGIPTTNASVDESNKSAESKTPAQQEPTIVQQNENAVAPPRRRAVEEEDAGSSDHVDSGIAEAPTSRALDLRRNADDGGLTATVTFPVSIEIPKRSSSAEANDESGKVSHSIVNDLAAELVDGPESSDVPSDTQDAESVASEDGRLQSPDPTVEKEVDALALGEKNQLRNSTSLEVAFILSDGEHRLRGGETMPFTPGEVRFHRGGAFGETKTSLKPGENYVFSVSLTEGWRLEQAGR